MTKYIITWVSLSLFAIGCASGPPKVASLDAGLSKSKISTSKDIKQIQYQELLSPESIKQPVVSEPIQSLADDHNLPQRLPPAEGLSIESLEQMALTNSPTIAQSEARVRALKGKWVQVGLPPNPTAGYVAGEIGNDGAAGQQGAFVGQDFITAKKLQRNRAIVSAEIAQAEQQLAAAQRRVQTDVRQGYYETLLAQRRVELAEELVHITGEAAKSSKALVEAEEIPLAGLLQTEVQEQNALVMLRTTENGLSRAWRTLSTVVGGVDLPTQPLTGDIGQLPSSLDWQEQLARLQSESPEIAIAMSEVERSRRALSRACVEAVPNISTQVSVQYDDSTGDTITGIQVGMPIPLWNRNQGGIRQAKAEITQAVRNVDRVELDLSRRLAGVFQDFSDALITTKTYRNDILPRSQKTFDLVQKGYKQGEVGYLDLLAAQQTFSQTNLAYLNAVGNLWQSYVRIEGLLLEGSLETTLDR